MSDVNDFKHPIPGLLLCCNVGNVYWDVYNSDDIVDSCGMFALSFLPLFTSPRSGIQKNLSFLKNIAKGTTDPRVQFILKVLTQSWSNFIFRISNRYQLQNLNQTWTSLLNFRISTKPSFRISSKIQLHNFLTSTKHQQKKLTKLQLQILSELKFFLTKPCAQSLNKSLAFWTNLNFRICNKLLPTQPSSATITTSTSFELASSHARVTSIKFTKQQWVSQWVS